MQKFALALRNTVSKSTKVSPALLNLGRFIRTPLDRSLQTEHSDDYDKDAQLLAKTLHESLKSIVEYVRKNIESSHEKNKID